VTLPEIRPSSNGNLKAPPDVSGAFSMHAPLEAPAVVATKRREGTRFPADPPARSFRSMLYNAYHHELAGTRLTRLLLFALALFAIVWAIMLPVRWLGAVGAAVAAAALIITLVVQRRRDFVAFEEGLMPDVTPAPLTPNEKIPIYATGQFAVEGDYQRYSYLPGYARIFSTGEHAILCLLRDRKFAGIGRWPALETGMWYIFFMSHDIRQVRYGSLKFEKEAATAIAVDYQLAVPASDSRRAKTLDETVYLVCVNEDDTPRLLADLCHACPTSDRRRSAVSSAE